MRTGLCVDTQRCLVQAGGPCHQLGTVHPENVQITVAVAPSAAARTQFTKLSDDSTKESNKEKWHENQTHLIPAPWGRQVRVSPALTNKINQASLSLLSCWCEKQVTLPMVKTPCFEATLPGFVTPFCYFLVVWSQTSHLTSLSLNHCTYKLEIITVTLQSIIRSAEIKHVLSLAPGNYKLHDLCCHYFITNHKYNSKYLTTNFTNESQFGDKRAGKWMRNFWSCV